MRVHARGHEHGLKGVYRPLGTHGTKHLSTSRSTERFRRAVKEQSKSEAAVNHTLGCLGWYVRETANATHSLTCVVLDRERNETRYPHDAAELPEEWQWQIQSSPSTSEHDEVRGGHLPVLCEILHSDLCSFMCILWRTRNQQTRPKGSLLIGPCLYAISSQTNACWAAWQFAHHLISSHLKSTPFPHLQQEDFVIGHKDSLPVTSWFLFWSSGKPTRLTLTSIRSHFGSRAISVEVDTVAVSAHVFHRFFVGFLFLVSTLFLLWPHVSTARC